jgi:hypothetical protein
MNRDTHQLWHLMSDSSWYERTRKIVVNGMTLERDELDNYDRAEYHKVLCAITSNHDILINF